MKFFKTPIYSLLFVYLIIAAVTIYFFNGTGGDGDSITHFLFAKYAPQHPRLFFDHWAKPVFVLLASPFAQFGFNGMKVFNVITVCFTIFFTYKIAEKYNLLNSYAVAIFLIFSPLYFVLTFSGLTEPLFAMFLSGAIYLTTKRNYLFAVILISFLAFVRSEGLLFIGVFGIYLLLKKKWKLIPWLATGHIVYSIAGYFVYHDLLWVFHKIPYARLDAVYGTGELTHFATQLFYILGLPSFILFLIGTYGVIKDTLNKKVSKGMLILVFFGFFIFLIAHSLFWYLGIFGSMGLTRVFICVIPLMALIMIRGFRLITDDYFVANKKLNLFLKVAILFYVMLFPFTKTHGSIYFDRDLNQTIDQKNADRTIEFMKEKCPVLPVLAYGLPYFSYALQIDPFENQKRTDLNLQNIQLLNKGDIVIWDDQFAVREAGLKKEMMDQNVLFEKVFETHMEAYDRVSNIILYQKK